MKQVGVLFAVLLAAPSALAAVPDLAFTVTMSEPVVVTGCPATCPRIALDVGGVLRYANFSAGSGTSSLTFTYSPVAGDLDLDGISISSTSIDLNTSGTITDLNGNALSPLTFSAPNTSGLKINYPSLSMDFVYDADGRYTLNGTAYNTLSEFLSATGGTFGRNSIGTYFDSSGIIQTASAHTPRLSYDPVTHAAKGILLEEGRTNMLLRSSELDNAAWPKTGVAVTANAATAPDGTLSADYVVADGSAFTYIISSSHTFLAGTTLTRSIFAKAGTSSKVIFEHHDGGAWGHTDYNLATQVITPATGVTASMVNVGNGWYRLIWTHSFTNDSTTSSTRTTYIDNYANGGAGQGVYLWGAQLEVGSFPTSYIPTTTVAATRIADYMSIPVAGWYAATQGTLFATAQGFGTSFSYKEIANINTNGNNRIRIMLANPTTPYQEITTLGASEYAYTSTISLGDLFSSALGYEANNTAGSINNSIPTPDLSVSLPAVTKLDVGSFANWTQKILYYPLRASNTQLQLLTQ